MAEWGRFPEERKRWWARKYIESFDAFDTREKEFAREAGLRYEELCAWVRKYYPQHEPNFVLIANNSRRKRDRRAS